MAEELLTVKDVAKRLGIHAQTVKVYIRSGQLRAISLGGHYRIALSDLQRFLDERATKPKE